MKDLDFRIRQARRIAGFSQTALAAALGVNRSAVAQWERPTGSKPTSANMRKLAVATRVQFEWLATGRGKMSIAVEGQGDDASSALVLNYYAHDEVEERMLIALRKLDYWQSVLLAEHAEGLAAGKLKG